MVLTDGADSSLNDGRFLKDTVGPDNEDREVTTGPRGYKLGARAPILGPARVSWPTEFNRNTDTEAGRADSSVAQAASPSAHSLGCPFSDPQDLLGPATT